MNLMTIEEVCDQLKMKKSTLYQMTCAKQIPYIKLGALLRFDPKQIDNWLKKQHTAHNRRIVVPPPGAYLRSAEKVYAAVF